MNDALSRSASLAKRNGARVANATILSYLPYLLATTIACYALYRLTGGSYANTLAFYYSINLLSSTFSFLTTSVIYAGYLDARAHENPATLPGSPVVFASPAAASEPQTLEFSNLQASIVSELPLRNSQPAADLSSTDMQMGRAYGTALSALPNSSLQQRLALLRDVLASDQTLWQPLRHLIEQPSFNRVLQEPSPAARQAALDAMLHELSLQYVPTVLVRVKAFLEGLL